MNLNEIADLISEDLPKWQRTANYEWLLKVHSSLKVGGVWAYPAWEMVFTKTEDGFKPMLDS